MTYLLGGGMDFSSGGPGKGMHSRLYQRVLTKKTWITNCTAYSNIFEATGLLGIMMSTPDPARGEELISVLCRRVAPALPSLHACGRFVVCISAQLVIGHFTVQWASAVRRCMSDKQVEQAQTLSRSTIRTNNV